MGNSSFIVVLSNFLYFHQMIFYIQKYTTLNQITYIFINLMTLFVYSTNVIPVKAPSEKYRCGLNSVIHVYHILIINILLQINV